MNNNNETARDGSNCLNFEKLNLNWGIWFKLECQTKDVKIPNQTLPKRKSNPNEKFNMNEKSHSNLPCDSILKLKLKMCTYNI